MDGTYANAPLARGAAKNQSAACGFKPNDFKPAPSREQVVDLWSELIRAQADQRTDEILGRYGVDGADTAPCCGLARIQITGKFFEPHDAGEYAVIVPIMEGDEMVDLLAFNPRRPEKWWCRIGSERLLGSTDNQLLGKPLHVFRTPLNWLRAGCDGVVPLDFNRAFIDLRYAPNDIVAEDEEHGRELREAMRQAALWGFPKMLVRE